MSLVAGGVGLRAGHHRRRAQRPVRGGHRPRPQRAGGAWTRPRCCPTTTSTATRGMDELPSAPVGPIEVRGRGDDAPGLGPGRAAPRRQRAPGGSAAASPSSTRRVKEIDTAPLPGTPSLIGWQSVANIIYIAGFDESSRAARGVDRPAHRQWRQPERRLRRLRHHPAQRAAAGHGLRRLRSRPGRGPRAPAGVGGPRRTAAAAWCRSTRAATPSPGGWPASASAPCWSR